MPIHDWTRVSAGTFHDFHCAWIVEIRNALNTGLLPRGYYAMAEQVAGEVNPDVITLQGPRPSGESDADGASGATALAEAPPRVSFRAATEMDQYTRKQHVLIVRHTSGDRIIAFVEILSPGNKNTRHGLRAFVEKAAGALFHGYHLLLIDLHPAGPRDPQGIHGALWAEICDDSYVRPPHKPLTLAAYLSNVVKEAYIEPIAVGDELPDMPLFLTSSHYVPVPLEATYRAAWRGVPQRWRAVLEAHS